MIDRFEHCRFCGGRGCAACPEEHRKWAGRGGSHPPPRPNPPPPPPPEVGPCHACGEPARWLCDGPTAPVPVTFSDGTPGVKYTRTCDRPMCETHLAYQSRVHVQRAGPGGRGRRCSWETVDYCADCLAAFNAEVDARRERQGLPALPAREAFPKKGGPE